MKQVHKMYRMIPESFAITSNPDNNIYYLEWICSYDRPDPELVETFEKDKSCICVKINPTIALMLITNFNPNLAYKTIATELLKIKPVPFKTDPSLHDLAKFIVSDIVPEVMFDELTPIAVKYTIKWDKWSMSKTSFYGSQKEGRVARALRKVFATSDKVNNLRLRKYVKKLALDECKSEILWRLYFKIEEGPLSKEVRIWQY